MSDLKNIIRALIVGNLDWMIVHKIASSGAITKDVEFSFVDGSERMDEPLKTNQGYISLKSNAAVYKFNKLISEITNEFIKNPSALSNIYIIISRTSCKQEDKNTLLNKFKKQIRISKCKILFNSLVDSLNNEYYKHSRLYENIPSNTSHYLELLRSAQYFHSNSDPLLYALGLVRKEAGNVLTFDLIEPLKHMPRAILFGFYGYDLIISPKKLKNLIDTKSELDFLSAYLLSEIEPDKKPPTWLNQKLVDVFVEEWETNGRFLFLHSYGLSYLNRHENKVYKKLKTTLHTNLAVQIASSSPSVFLNNLNFPDGFIALFEWFHEKKLDISKISSENKRKIITGFINELKKISTNFPNYLSIENNSDPFSSFQLSELKYQRSLAYLLYFILSSEPNDLKELRKVCHDFKGLFYGSYRPTSIARYFSELMLLIALSGLNITNWSPDFEKALKTLIKILNETILIPYIHLTEREEEIWNPESDKPTFSFSAGKYLVNEKLKKVSNSKTVSPYYQDLLDLFNEVKIAVWPYERG